MTFTSHNPSVKELLEQCQQYAETDAESFRGAGWSQEDLQAEAERRARVHYPFDSDNQIDWLEMPGEVAGEGLRSTYEMVFRSVAH